MYFFLPSFFVIELMNTLKNINSFFALLDAILLYLTEYFGFSTLCGFHAEDAAKVTSPRLNI